MRKFLLIGFFTLGVSFHAQKQKQTLKKKTSTIVNNAKNQKSNNSQQNIKVEIVNSGDWNQYEQSSWWRIVKRNDKDLSQILNLDNSQLQISESAMGNNNWRDENGNFSFRSISEPLKISQEFINKKNEKGENRDSVAENEAFETTALISSLSFKILLHPKDNKADTSKNIAKTITIFSDGQLVKTLIYSYDDLVQKGGISIENFNVEIDKSNIN
ncbi:MULTISPECIES: hypothetical protein [Chryseobacterium group]|uniref:Uncharacterized protein n=1 Tax=Kaistella carnis TaxID=1241979 RepID=A0A3G8XM06_9FLAO|nr:MULTISPECIES: hypothetical protein [Chryseobacterium group]AZI33878.1 hypothetical protein EIB73_12085 [Kaistella carnis]QDP84951.1 hypothetical protein FNJ88_05035 [Chryseobacterium sp. SNU WT5]